jgi:hypothetical protein
MELRGNGTAGNGEGGTSVNNGVALTPTQGAVRKNAADATDTNNNDPDFDVVTDPFPGTRRHDPMRNVRREGDHERILMVTAGATSLCSGRPRATGYLQRSTSGFTGINFGLSDDIPTPGDF